MAGDIPEPPPGPPVPGPVTPPRVLRELAVEGRALATLPARCYLWVEPTRVGRGADGGAGEGGKGARVALRHHEEARGLTVHHLGGVPWVQSV